jgi:hypothetical protein
VDGTIFASTDVSDAAVVTIVVLSRLIVPLFIPRFPLVIIAALIIDAADQTVLAALTDVDTSETGLYQSYDKAMDIYYLSIAYLSTMRNWTSDAAFRISQFLFFYRLVGVTLFELLHERWLLLVFPNTFEYFFIAYEVVRLRYEPARRSARFWLLLAAFIWIFIKLPQEYWIHVAQLDFTDAVRDHPWFGVAIVVALVALAIACWLLRKRLPPYEHPLRWTADALPREAARALAQASPWRFLSTELLEKVVLLGLTCVIFSQFLPGVDGSPLEVIVGVAIVVVANTLVSELVARRSRREVRYGIARFAALVALNLVFVLATAGFIGLDGGDTATALFFAYLISLILWLYDWYRPLYDARRASDGRVTSFGDFTRRVRLRTP